MEAQASLRAVEEGNLTAVLANLLDMMVSEQVNSLDFTISSLDQILAWFQWLQNITKKMCIAHWGSPFINSQGMKQGRSC